MMKAEYYEEPKLFYGCNKLFNSINKIFQSFMLKIFSLLVAGNLADSFLFVSNKTIKYKDKKIMKIKDKIATSNLNIAYDFLIYICLHK